MGEEEENCRYVKKVVGDHSEYRYFELPLSGRYTHSVEEIREKKLQREGDWFRGLGGRIGTIKGKG